MSSPAGRIVVTRRAGRSSAWVHQPVSGVPRRVRARSVEQGAARRGVAAAGGGGEQRLVDHVALRMAAAEAGAARRRAAAASSRHGVVEARRRRRRGGRASAARPTRATTVAVPRRRCARRRRATASTQRARRVALAGAEQGDQRVHVVEGRVPAAAGSSRRPAGEQALPARRRRRRRAGRSRQSSEAASTRCSVISFALGTQVERRTAPARLAWSQRLEREQRLVPAEVAGEAVALGPRTAARCAIQTRALGVPALHLHDVGDGVDRPRHARRSRPARAGRPPRPRRSGPTPRGRRRAWPST